MRWRAVSILLMLSDIVIVSLAPFVALYIRFEGLINAANLPYFEAILRHLPVIIIVRIGVFYIFGLYKRLWRYASISELLGIIGAVSVSSILLAIFLIGIHSGIPRSVHFVSWFLNILMIGGSRLAVRVYYYLRNRRYTCAAQSHVLIVGAGDAGAMIAREIRQQYFESKKLVGFVDDDLNKQNKLLLGEKILGTCKDIGDIVKKHCINEIIIAMPSVTGSVVRKIIQECKNTKCTVKTVPSLLGLIDGKVSVQQLRNIDLEDLLRRDPIELDMNQVASYILDKRILVTGAGGSIGSELCRQIAKMSPKELIILGKGENSIFEILQELNTKHPELYVEPVIADVRDQARISQIFSQVKPQVVFHAAAHKHVPLMEQQPGEAIRNNVFGTKIVAEAADRAATEVFVMISTDKAVNPTSVMGASKRVAELIIQNMNRISATRFVAVRFGNVLGSRGSVIPLFKKQIAQGGPITITHPDMKRYFMTIPEATQLVLQAGSFAKGGEVFVLDMGEPVKILDMACDLIELSGFRPYKDIKIEFKGLRPGEKLFEELMTAEEGTTSTKHKKIYVANLKTVSEERLLQGLYELQNNHDTDRIIEILSTLIPTYKSSKIKVANTSDESIKFIKLETPNTNIGELETATDL